MADEECMRETDYQFVVRSQINTSAHKMDAYYCYRPLATSTGVLEHTHDYEGAQEDTRDHEGAHTKKVLVVLKGPFLAYKQIEYALEMQKWKMDNNLPCVELRALRLIPDRWPQGVPLGQRNKLPHITKFLAAAASSIAALQSLMDSLKPTWFLESVSLISMEEIHMRMHGPTKKWPLTEVLAQDDMDYKWCPKDSWTTYTHQEKLDYVLSLISRYIVGISDQADRNFMRVNGRVYTFDEDTRCNREVNMWKELRKNKCAQIRSFMLEWNDAEDMRAIEQIYDEVSLWICATEEEEERRAKITETNADMLAMFEEH